jgi:hypothetical protein
MPGGGDDAYANGERAAMGAGALSPERHGPAAREGKTVIPAEHEGLEHHPIKGACSHGCGSAIRQRRVFSVKV